MIISFNDWKLVKYLATSDRFCRDDHGDRPEKATFAYYMLKRRNEDEADVKEWKIVRESMWIGRKRIESKWIENLRSGKSKAEVNKLRAAVQSSVTNGSGREVKEW